jgi:hypothetical protein
LAGTDLTDNSILLGLGRNWLWHLSPATKERLYRNHHQGTTDPPVYHYGCPWDHPVHPSNKEGNQRKCIVDDGRVVWSLTCLSFCSMWHY